MRHAVFTEDGLDLVCDTSADAAAHVVDLRGMVFEVRRFQADDETIFDIGHDALRDGKSWAVARRLMVAAVDASAAAAPVSDPLLVPMAGLGDDEQFIISALLYDAAMSGFMVSVFDGEEWALSPTLDFAAVQAVIGATGETTLRFRNPALLDESGKPSDVGSVLLIHGNGCDVISDYSDAPGMVSLIAGAVAASDRLGVAS